MRGPTCSLEETICFVFERCALDDCVLMLRERAFEAALRVNDVFDNANENQFVMY